MNYKKFSIFIFVFLTAGCSSLHHNPQPKPLTLDPSQYKAYSENLGDHHFKITTSKPEAQKAFDRGLTLAYSFSHERAQVEFLKAAMLDPQCAMAWWGVALVNGPHINFPIVTPEHALKALEALSKAIALVDHVSPIEKELIHALEKRYANPQPQDRSPLDRTYADAMREVFNHFPNDPDVGALFAEAMMDLRPWDLWTADFKPQPGTEEIVATLQKVLELDPNHPGANHFYIHVMENSPEPKEALASADRLNTLVPAASHMVHMPAHIYARIGRWEDAAQADLNAMEVDKMYNALNPRPGFYAMYMAHNKHFYAYTAMMEGKSAQAIQYAREMVKGIPDEFLSEYTPLADGFMIFVSEVLMRFGRWEELLNEPEPRSDLVLSRALWHFTRATAYTALEKFDEAEKERQSFFQATAKVPKEWTFGNNPAAEILAVAAHSLNGEIAAKHSRWDDAVNELRAAVKIEDSLKYDEPPDWILPVRHSLGAVLMKAGRFEQAEEIYREDLKRYAENGWSLLGLYNALTAQGKKKEAKKTKLRFQKAWQYSDVAPSTTCYCQIEETTK